MTRELLTAERLREVLGYDPETGAFTWRVTRGKARRGRDAGYRDARGYIHIRIYGALYKAHRLAWFFVCESWPESQMDHVNRDKGDNRIHNLRQATNFENQRNGDVQSNNTSGFTGVRWDKKTSKWHSYITVFGRQKNLGFYASRADAIAARKAGETQHHGDFAPGQA